MKLNQLILYHQAILAILGYQNIMTGFNMQQTLKVSQFSVPYYQRWEHTILMSYIILFL